MSHSQLFYIEIPFKTNIMPNNSKKSTGFDPLGIHPKLTDAFYSTITCFFKGNRICFLLDLYPKISQQSKEN